jgi:hypothetical protein
MTITAATGRRTDEPMSVKHEEPTAVEELALVLCELREDIDGLIYRLFRDRPQRSPEAETAERRARWERTLAIVEAALAERRG